jgi:DNA-binding response OmpR family regulator
MSNSLRKIAVIEDEPALGELYKIKLSLEGFAVKTALDGQQGLQMITDFRPELILLDLRMPVMSGDEMLARLREKDWGSDIRVIVLTNISKSEAPASLRFLGVDRYVVKAHHTPAQVVDMVREVLAENSGR